MNRKDFARKHALALATIGFVPLAAWNNWSLPAKAADVQQPVSAPAPTYDMVDFASGWYVRGDVAYAQETFPEIAPTVGSTPSVLNSYSTGAGIGYKVNDWFRTDLILDFRSPVHAAGGGNPTFCEVPDVNTGLNPPAAATCVGHFNTEIRRWDLLANGYIDLGTWEGFTPYLGAGAGVTWARTSQSVNFTLLDGVPCQAMCGFLDPARTFVFSDFDRSGGHLRYQFAWALMAGVAVAVTDHVQIDAGYRFLDLGTVSGTSSVTGTSTTPRAIANEVRAGLRFMID